MIEYYEGYVKPLEEFKFNTDLLCREFYINSHKLKEYGRFKQGASEYFITPEELLLLPETYRLSQSVKTVFNYTDICYRALDSQQAYLWHRDNEKLCIHVPLITNSGCWFVYEGQCFHLPANGVPYLVNNDRPHTFVNAGSDIRVHIIFMKKHNDVVLKLKNKLTY